MRKGNSFRCSKCKQTCPSKLTLVFHIARGFCYPEVPREC